MFLVLSEEISDDQESGELSDSGDQALNQDSEEDEQENDDDDDDDDDDDGDNLDILDDLESLIQRQNDHVDSKASGSSNPYWPFPNKTV